jgi:hypothetical protein
MTVFEQKSDSVYKTTVLTEGQIDTAERGIVRKRSRGQRIRRCVKRDLKRLFLQSFGRTGNVSQTCRELLVARNTVYVWMHRDPVFAERYHENEQGLYTPREAAYEPIIGGLEERVGMMSDRDLMRAFKIMSRGNRFW